MSFHGDLYLHGFLSGFYDNGRYSLLNALYNTFLRNGCYFEVFARIRNGIVTITAIINKKETRFTFLLLKKHGFGICTRLQTTGQTTVIQRISKKLAQ